MNAAQGKLFKNTSILMISQVIGWALALVLTLYLPRYLGVENIGKYQLAVSLWATVVILATFGMDTYLTREIAQDHNRVDILLSQSIILKITFFLFGCLLLATFVSISGYEPDTVLVIAIIGVANLITLFSSGLSATIQGLERVEFLGVAGVLASFISTLATLIAIFLGAQLFTIAWVSSISALATLTFYAVVLHRIRGFHFVFSLKNAKPFLFASVAFFLLQVFINLYQQVDIIVISWILDERGVGWYGVAARLAGSLMFIPTVFMTVFFPTFSRLQRESPEELTKLFRKAFQFMLLLGIAVGLGMFIIAVPLITILYGDEFANSGPILALRGLVSIPTFLNIIIGIYLIAKNRQKGWVIVMALATVATIPLDLFFIPLCQHFFNNGAMGGAYSFFVTETGMTIAGILLLPKYTLNRDMVWYSIRATLAGLGMLAAAWWFRDYFIAVPIIIGGAVFLILTVLFKLISKEEWVTFSVIFASILNKVFRKPVPEVHEI